MPNRFLFVWSLFAQILGSDEGWCSEAAGVSVDAAGKDPANHLQRLPVLEAVVPAAATGAMAESRSRNRGLELE